MIVVKATQYKPINICSIYIPPHDKTIKETKKKSCQTSLTPLSKQIQPKNDLKTSQPLSNKKNKTT